MLNGKVAIVTASTRGIGYACVETLAKAGARVYMACRNLEVGNEKTAALCAQGLDVKTVYFEAYDKDSILNMIDTVVANEGRIDILVNNFGGTKPYDDKTIFDTDYDDFARYVEVHMSTVFRASQAAALNITCNVVCPGMTATEAVKNNLTPEFQEFFLKHTPIRRMGEPQEIADAVLYFAEAPYTTGQVLAVHGGFGIPTPVYGDMLSMKNKR